MDDLINRQAALDALGERPLQWDDNQFELGLVVQFDADRRMLEAVPSADAVKVVRCGECRHWHNAPTADGFNSCEMDALIRHENFFCANGEKKDDNTSTI